MRNHDHAGRNARVNKLCSQCPGGAGACVDTTLGTDHRRVTRYCAAGEFKGLFARGSLTTLTRSAEAALPPGAAFRAINNERLLFPCPPE